MQPVTTASPLPTATGTCPLCGATLEDANTCSKCDWVRHPEEGETSGAKARDMTALILSVIPGAGHLFKGHQKLGLFLMLIGIPAVAVLAFAFTMFFGWLWIPVYWIGVGTDAFFRTDLRAHAATQPR